MVAVAPAEEGWMLEASGLATQSVEDQQRVRAGGLEWLLELPPASAATTESTELEQAIELARSTMRFQVSRDGEHLCVELCTPQQEVVGLPPRAHQHVLLALARHRVADAQAGLPVDEVGWLYADELQRELRMDRTRVNIEIYRARRLLAQHGVSSPGGIVERRKDTQQMRLGVTHIEIAEG
jgi:hypothetical protein